LAKVVDIVFILLIVLLGYGIYRQLEVEQWEYIQAITGMDQAIEMPWQGSRCWMKPFEK